jgi:transketolase
MTSPDYQRQVLPPSVKTRLAVEAGIPMGWEKYVGRAGDVIGMTGFGASAPGPVVMEKFGFTAEQVIARAKKLLGR